MTAIRKLVLSTSGICQSPCAFTSPEACAASSSTVGERVQIVSTKRMSILAMGLASAAILCTALATAVVDIVERRSDEQVVRVDASPVIALVANEQSVWYRAVGHYPRNSVSPCLSWTRVLGMYCTIPIHVLVPSPLPAPSKFRDVRLDWTILVNVLPESSDDTFCKFHRLIQRTTPAGCGAAKREPAGGRSVVGESWPRSLCGMIRKECT